MENFPGATFLIREGNAFFFQNILYLMVWGIPILGATLNIFAKAKFISGSILESSVVWKLHFWIWFFFPDFFSKLYKMAGHITSSNYKYHVEFLQNWQCSQAANDLEAVLSLSKLLRSDNFDHCSASLKSSESCQQPRGHH